MAGIVPPPGNEAAIVKEHQYLQELLGFLKNDTNPDFSVYKGNAYVFKM